MRYILTLFWAVLICSVISYVLTNMGGTSFDMVQTLALAVIMTLFVSILGEGVITAEQE